MNKWQRVTSMTMSVVMLMICLGNTHIIAQAEEQEEPTTPIIFIGETQMIEETPQTELLENTYLTSEIIFCIEIEEIEKVTPGLISEMPYKVYEEKVVATVNPPMDSHLTKSAGVFYGPSGKETYYNLNMNRCISVMRGLGYDEANYPYWIREDGVKMLGDYVMVAADFSIRPRGTLVKTSLGIGIVVDTGTFARYDSTGLDIATSW